MPQDWQIYFIINGLIAPKEGLLFDDRLLFRGTEESDDIAMVFFKVTIENEDELNQQDKEVRKELRKILQIYGLLANEYAEVPSAWSRTIISPDVPFGRPQYPTPPPTPGVSILRKLNEEQMCWYTTQLKNTIEKYRLIRNILEERGKAFLRNAIDYYHRALGDRRLLGYRSLEEQLIDLMIALESLLTKKEELQELRLRISLRAAFLLSVGKESERPSIYRQISDLYKKRGNVVHGVERVDLSYGELSNLQSYVLGSIKRLIHIEEPKDEILKLLDEAVYDEEKRRQLEKTILESLSSWNLDI